MSKCIIIAIKQTFGMHDSSLTLSDIDNTRMNTIKGLSALVKLLADKDSSPHAISIELEAIILQIKLDSKPSAYAVRFLDLINKLVYEPHYLDLNNPGLN